jgi:glycoprotein-N-acetylgalactosamine 3-beta-galactosyltransferase
VYTISTNHDGLHRIRETWGPKCDGFMVGSNLTDPVLGTVNIPHEGEEAYMNIWQKVRSMWSYIYDNYYEKYDWFHIGGDDLYLIVENLRLYLESEEIRTASNGGIYLPDGTEKMQTPLFLGRRFAYQGDMNDIFNSGGSGYTLNKAALKSIVVEGLPKIFPHAHTFSEDTMIARVLRQGFGVYPYETKDEAGGERYMPFMPGHHYGYRMPADKTQDWYARYSINIKMGLDHCAARSVAFHYVKGTAMYRLHALLYHLCPDDAAAAAAITAT